MWLAFNRGNLLRSNHQLTINSQLTGMARCNILEVPINMLGYQLTLFDGLGLEPGNLLRPLFFGASHLIIKENKQPYQTFG